MKSPRLLSRGVIVSSLVVFFLAGCAQNPDVRIGHDHISGTIAKSPPDYMVCVQDELRGSSSTFVLKDNNSLKLFVENTDPDKASGLVEVHVSGQQYHYSAYQRDAWYDHGRLLDAAFVCSRT
ncbi:hypothetical protein [Pseudomonas putida]|uniref:hypothetical protein n=1 Tax=Pseudomonas putida TaxID=303 RepID=UPI0023663F17|nr:hypothetical protein [Pseudomonas putida]MDD2048326.1 hypothetical protein [Pseudomonas putida]